MGAITLCDGTGLAPGKTSLGGNRRKRQLDMGQHTDRTRSQHRHADNDPTSRALGELESMYPDSEWDAGDMGCGELVLELRMRLKPMRPGQTLKVTARDPGAPEDLPAWCRLTGHHLTYVDHPIYVFRRKED
jgi:tRNA 2-thiouridine synthesizing protein A